MRRGRFSLWMNKAVSLMMTLVMLLTGSVLFGTLDAFAEEEEPAVTEELTETGEEPVSAGYETADPEGDVSSAPEEQADSDADPVSDPEPDPVIYYRDKPVTNPNFLHSAECIALEDPVECPFICSEPLGYVVEGNGQCEECIEVTDGGKYIKGIKYGGCAVRYYVIGREDIYAKVFVSVRPERKDQTIDGPDAVAGIVGEKIQVKDNWTADTYVVSTYGDYGVCSCPASGATIDLKKAGSVQITLVAGSSSGFRRAERQITVTVTDPEGEARAAAAKKAAALRKPSLKVKRYRKKNKLTWTQVPGTAGYQIYIKYPGQKNYKWALTKGAGVKSVTHKGLKRKKYYSYKVRPFIRYGGKVYYGPFSKAVTVKVK